MSKCTFAALFSLMLFTLWSCDRTSENNRTTADSTTTTSMLTKKDLTPPVADKEPETLSLHGDTRTDNYYWMRLSDEQKNAETPDTHTQRVTTYLEAENAYREEMMSHLKPLQEKLYEEIRGRIKETDLSVPYKDNGYFYYVRYEEGQEYPIYARKAGSLEADEAIMLNVNEMAEDFDYYNVGGMSVSPSNRLVAYGEDTLSRRIYTIRIKNLETGDHLEDVIPNTTGRAIWANDNKTLFYSVKDDALRSYKIFKHKLGTPASQDVEVYHEKDDTFGTFVTKTKSKKYIVIGSYQTLSSEYRYVNADTPDDAFRVILPRERNHEYSVSHYGDHWYIRSNADAKNFRLVRAPVGETSKNTGEEIIPNRDDVLLVLGVEARITTEANRAKRGTGNGRLILNRRGGDLARAERHVEEQ